MFPKIKKSLAHEEIFRNNIKERFDKILNCRLMSIVLKGLPDDCLLEELSDYDEYNHVECENFCTWLTIGETILDSYNGKDYYLTEFESNGEKMFSINHSQFIYPMTLRDDSFFPKYGSGKSCRCLVDGNIIDPLPFFSNNKGKRILLLYFFPAVTSFNNEKNCYHFALNNLAPNEIRKAIYCGLRFVLGYTIKYPTVNAPTYSLKFEADNGVVTYRHGFSGEEGDSIIMEIFNRDYKTTFIEKYNEIEREIAKMK